MKVLLENARKIPKNPEKTLKKLGSIPLLVC